jgi:dihydrofolate reductase
MRKLAVTEFLTLDGVMQGLGSPDEDREGGFEHGGWGAPYGDEVLGRRAAQGMGRTTAYLFGRKTFEKMAAHWPFQPDDDPIAKHLNATPKYVVTATLSDVQWAGSHILRGDAVESVQKLKAEGEGDINVLGTGKRLFRTTPHPLRLRLVDCTVTTTGVVLLDYEPA